MVRTVECRTITIPPQLWKEFGGICDKQGYERSKLIRTWIAKWIKIKQKTDI